MTNTTGAFQVLTNASRSKTASEKEPIVLRPSTCITNLYTRFNICNCANFQHVIHRRFKNLEGFYLLFYSPNCVFIKKSKWLQCVWYRKVHLLPLPTATFSSTQPPSPTPASPHNIMLLTLIHCRSQYPRGLRRRFSAARLLRSWVRIPPGAWMFVCCGVICCQVEVSATTWSPVQRSPTDCGASLCVIKKPRKRGG